MSTFLRLHKLIFIFLPVFKSFLQPGATYKNLHSSISEPFNLLHIPAISQNGLSQFIKSPYNIKQ
jgi:hypothetical protein